MATYSFRPRYRALAWSTVGVGAAVLGAALALGWPAFALGFGGGGAGLGALYLLSPAWRYRARVDDEALEVVDHRGDRKFRIRWGEVDRCIASPDTKTCLISGGGPDSTLIVPGPGAPAPYDIRDKRALYDEIVRRVPADKIEEVDLVERAVT